MNPSGHLPVSVPQEPRGSLFPLPHVGPLPGLCLRLQPQSPGRAFPSFGWVPPPTCTRPALGPGEGAELPGNPSHFSMQWTVEGERGVRGCRDAESDLRLPARLLGRLFRGLLVVFCWPFKGVCHTLSSVLRRCGSVSSYCSDSSLVFPFVKQILLECV